MRMNTNDTNGKIIYPTLSYLITGICFDIHNSLGRYSREKQYCNDLELRLKQAKVPYKREFNIKATGNVLDFVIDDKIILEVKAKPVLLKEDYYQLQRYLQTLNINLGLLVNFRNRYLKPARVVRIETDTRKKFTNSMSV